MPLFDAHFGELFLFMIYSKFPLSISKQLEKLLSKGLIIEDQSFAKKKLKSVNYYRLSAYFSPFYELKTKKFKNATTFKDVSNLYDFDEDLRLTIFGCVQKIEIAIRSRIINSYSNNFNAHWFLNKKRYKKFESYINFQKSALTIIEQNQKKEKFIEHYISKYNEPIIPVNWMVIEMLTLGQLSRLYKSLNDDRIKKGIADDFGITELVLESWLHNLNYIRNICAHHYRLWNRDLGITPKFPRRVKYPFLVQKRGFSHEKIYLTLSVIIYLLDRIELNSQKKSTLIKFIDELPPFYKDKMGLPGFYKSETLWN